MKRIVWKNIVSVSLSTIVSYLAPNLTAVSLSLILKLDEKIGAILLKKKQKFADWMNEKIEWNKNLEFLVIIHKSKASE